MTRTQLNHQVARITGEPIDYITALGFSLLRPGGESMEPEDIRLVLECPFCGRPVPYPGFAAAGSEPMAECERCDVYFSFDPEVIYVVESDNRLSDASGSSDKFHRYETTEKPGL
jgi:hypothetical protein